MNDTLLPRVRCLSQNHCDQRDRHVVVGDYGAFLELEECEMATEKLEIEPSQAYRTKSGWRDRVKYLWLRPKDGHAKVYHQTRTVRYADYRPGRYYLSPFETELR